MGGKARVARHIVPILESIRPSGATWVEPFAGSCNTLALASGDRIGYDACPYIIAVYQAAIDGWQPPSEVPEDMYNAIARDVDAYPPHVVGFVMYGCSYGGKWRGGYARDPSGRNYAAMSIRSILRKAAMLDGVQLHHGDYRSINVPPNSLIYCDPPYAGRTAYKSDFDTGEFADWCVSMRAAGHIVAVSEYTPLPVRCTEIWAAQRRNSGLRGRTGVERLYLID